MSFVVKLKDLISENADGGSLVINAFKEILAEKTTMQLGMRIDAVLAKIMPVINDYFKRKIELVKDNGAEVLNPEGKCVGYQTHADKQQMVLDQLAAAVELDIEIPIEKFSWADILELNITGYSRHALKEWLFDLDTINKMSEKEITPNAS